MQDTVNYEIKDDEFIITNYNKAKAFASFFPSIAGLWGKPMWVFYVNRAQSISCMGTRDKNGAILEFVAANKAYRLTPTHGFRTFIRSSRGFYEPFQSGLEKDPSRIVQRMHITSYLLKLVEKNEEAGFEVTVEYFTLPNENLPGLARRLILKNISGSPVDLDCLDGLPLFTPFGTNDYLLKNMSRLAEGWFSGVEFSKRNKVPYYRIRVEPEDKPEIFEIHEGNFYAGFFRTGEKVLSPRYVIDPELVFGEMKDMLFPMEFIRDREFGNSAGDTAKNKTPTAMGYFKTSLGPNETFCYCSVIGHGLLIDDADDFIERFSRPDYFDLKLMENKRVIQGLGNRILTRSASQEFDNYTQQTFIDNLLRGGFPLTLGQGARRKIYYSFSRIHGDMEREYNNFVIMPEYFSQGNGSYRDVDQNRRNDVFFNPDVKDEPIVYFMNLIQTDGFNPLRIMGSKFKARNKKPILTMFKNADRPRIQKFMAVPFTLGGFFHFLEKEKIKVSVSKQKLLDRIIDHTEKIDYAEVGEGYWSDHWHYNIDLIESYLALYPEKKKDLLLKRKVFTFYDNPKVVAPRSEKYVLFHNKPRQLRAVYTDKVKQHLIESRKENPHLVRTRYGKGIVYKTTLMGKLLCLVANKFASLDPEGVGVEMETDKPNWCDALNGLPGLFGSSTAESLELKRLVRFIISSLEGTDLGDTDRISTAAEIIDFLMKLEKAALRHQDDQFRFWDETHTIKEKYRARTMYGLSGKEQAILVGRLKSMLDLFLKKIEKGLAGALDPKSRVIQTNFEHMVEKYKKLKSGARDEFPRIRPFQFRQIPLKLFLEGPVHYLRICEHKDEARDFHQRVMRSRLYDPELKMLKVNEPLEETSLNIGRITVFTPGWLENESVWLHMEYKYLLELLRHGLADEFYRVMKDMLVPFMDPHKYGRSIFENSSFIASSAHPEKKVHGQGFVARLSGSTAEFISLWIAMTSGLVPFTLEKNELILRFKPQLAGWMFTNKEEMVKVLLNDSSEEEILLPVNSFLFTFLGGIIVIYRNSGRKDTFGKDQGKLHRITLTYFNGKQISLEGDLIPAPYALDVRSRKVKLIEIMIQ